MGVAIHKEQIIFIDRSVLNWPIQFINNKCKKFGENIFRFSIVIILILTYYDVTCLLGIFCVLLLLTLEVQTEFGFVKCHNTVPMVIQALALLIILLVIF